MFKCIQFLCPEYPVLFYPVGYFIQFLQLSFAISFTAPLFYNDQTAFGQYFNMLEMAGRLMSKFSATAFRLSD